MRQRAVFEGWDQKVLDTRIDKMWGNVTLFNCYLFFVQLSAKKVPRPLVALENELNEGKITEAEYNVKIDDPHIKSREKFWDGNDEIDMLTLFFNATDELPTNGSVTWWATLIRRCVLWVVRRRCWHLSMVLLLPRCRFSLTRQFRH